MESSKRASCAGMITLVLTSLAVAQTPPTATEAFNLRIRCKEMADKKALEKNAAIESDASISRRLGYVYEVVHFTYPSSKYDAKNNRCYVELLFHTRGGIRKEDQQTRELYDAQLDDLLAFARIKNGVKVGMVFDHEHRTTRDTNLGW